MGFEFPDYLNVTPQDLGRGTPVTVHVNGEMADVARQMAEDILGVIREAAQQDLTATMIIPVGPVDQFPILAERINQQRCDCRHVMFINMDEYLTEDDRWIDRDHPLSFRGYMDRKFYDLIDPDLAPPAENRVFPHPERLGEVQQLIDQRGGVDVCFGGIGINGHMAFNEPPEPGESVPPAEEFAQLPTRVLQLSRETRTINSVTVGGEISLIPRRAVTVGMKEILGSHRLRFYCNRPWQSSVIRRVLHGSLTAACPASLMRNHPDAALTVAQYVAALPDIRLR